MAASKLELHITQPTNKIAKKFPMFSASSCLAEPMTMVYDKKKETRSGNSKMADP